MKIGSKWRKDPKAPWQRESKTRKPVFGICDQVTLKPACSVGYSIYISTEGWTETGRRRYLLYYTITETLISWSASLLFAHGINMLLMTWLSVWACKVPLHYFQPGLHISHHADDTLNSFCQWQTTISRRKQHDHAVLLTGVDICSYRNAPCDTLGKLLMQVRYSG